MHEHPDFADLVKRMTRVAPKAVPFKGILFRACSPKYANQRDLLTGAGAFKTGGRWNAPESFPLVYLSLSVEGAVAETLGVAGHYGFDPASRLPLTLVAINATLDRVIDLTNPAVRKISGISYTQMTICDWRADNSAGNEAFTQALGRAALESGFQAIRVPSAIHKKFCNINVFSDPRSPVGKLEICHVDKLSPAQNL